MRQKALLCVSLIILGLVGGYAYWTGVNLRGHQAPERVASVVAAQTKPKSSAVSISGSYLVSGDVFWGRGIDLYSQHSTLKYDWGFSRLSEFSPEHYDGWISDLECPVTDITVPYQTQVDKLILQCPPAYLQAAGKYFTAFNIANNHTGNTGLKGFLDTRQNLDKAGLQYFGHYDLSQKDDLCEVVALPAKVGDKTVRLPIAMCGYHWLARQPTDGELAEITRYAKFFPVWVFAHGGPEYSLTHSSAQQALYHKMIDLGASAVFGGHPHVVQDTESYKGKMIIYSFGNLVYDQWFDNDVTKSLIVNVKISALMDSNLQSYIDMGATCAAFKDDCLARAEQDDLSAPKFTYSYDALVGDSSNDNDFTRRKHPATAAVKQALLDRIKWAQTQSGISSQPL